MARFGNDALTHHNDAESAVVLTGISSMDESLNSQILSADTGAPYDEDPSIGSQSPVLGFTTEDLEKAITLYGLSGKCIKSTLNPGVVMYRSRHDPCGPNGRASGSVHFSSTVGGGHCYITSISADAGGNARGSIAVHAVDSDGVTYGTGETDPITRAWNAALPSWGDDEAYKLGPMVIAGKIVSPVTSLSMTFAHVFEKPIHADHTYPRFHDHQKTRVTVSATIDDPEGILSSTIHASVQTGAAGKRLTTISAADTAGSYVQFRKTIKAADGAPEAPAGSLHIRGGLNGLLHIPQPWTASGPNAGKLQLEIVCNQNSSDATYLPVIWAVNQAMFVEVP